MAGPVLVIGGRGFFGRRISEALRTSGKEVLTGNRVSGDVALDLLDPESIEAAICECRPGTVVCAAGVAAAADAADDPAGCFRVNVGGTFNLLEQLGRHCRAARLVFISSAAVYAASADRLPEEAPTRPDSIYAASKLAAEMLCHQHAAAGHRTTVLRVFNLIGPGQPADQAPGEFARAADTAMSLGKTEATVKVRDPQISRDYTDVRDAARGVAMVIEKSATGTFNLCSGKAVSLEELAGVFGEAASGPRPFRLELEGSLPPRPGDPGTVTGDPSRILEATGWKANTPLRESVADLLADLESGEAKPEG